MYRRAPRVHAEVDRDVGVGAARAAPREHVPLGSEPRTRASRLPRTREEAGETAAQRARAAVADVLGASQIAPDALAHARYDLHRARAHSGRAGGSDGDGRKERGRRGWVSWDSAKPVVLAAVVGVTGDEASAGPPAGE